MRRFGLGIIGLALCVVASACTSSTAPDRKNGEWMPNGTWCSGYITVGGECVEDDGGN